MKIIHTSDWHLGKRLEDRPRLPEQKLALNSLVGYVKENDVSLVIVAGDVFDTFTPSAEAEQTFFDTLYQLTNAGAVVLVISGNHDDPTRLSASAKISNLSGVLFSGGETDDSKRVYPRATVVCSSADHAVIRGADGETVFVSMLPFPTEARMKEAADDDESYPDKIKRYIGCSLNKNLDNLPVVLAAHIFMLGGETSLSERPIELGGTRAVPKSVIPENVIYTALGHLHKRQVVSMERNIIYSGSLLQYSFDEAGFDKSFTVIDVVGGKVENIKTIEYDGYYKLLRLNASSYQEAFSVLENAPDTYVELTLTLSEPLSGEQTRALVGKFPKLFLRTRFTGGSVSEKSRRLMTDEELFKSFYLSQYGVEPDEKVTELFLNLVSSVEVGDET